ncbi:MAG: hypothetical protein KAW12_18045 [Candidatus Aminicenantes bacterium]|nr:hypothetical protein [Candidatus Aminicenantes bacterium]
MDICPICGEGLLNRSQENKNEESFSNVVCIICGKYSIAGKPEIFSVAHTPMELEGNYKNKNYILSGVIRNANKMGKTIMVTKSNISDLIDSVSVPENPFEIIDQILLYIYELASSVHEFVRIEIKQYPLFYAKNSGDLDYCLKRAREHGYLQNSASKFRLTLDGWQRVEELQRKKIESRQAFVAMKFSDDLKSIWTEGFEPALKETGYKPIRLDFVEHNDRIDDKIIAEIRKSGLLVADLTGNNAGVYFEAGFALGLDIPVIWTCRSDFIEKIHFDTRQYNYIVWENPAELNEKLKNRIEATLPLQ